MDAPSAFSREERDLPGEGVSGIRVECPELDSGRKDFEVDFIGQAAATNLAWEIRLGGQGRRRKSLMGNECSSVPSLPGLDPLVTLTRHFRAGLLIVPSLRDWVCCL